MSDEATGPEIQRRAARLAQTLKRQEVAIRQNMEAMAAFVEAHPGMGPLTRDTFNAEATAVLALAGRLHLAVTPFDPRPRPRDGGGGK